MLNLQYEAQAIGIDASRLPAHPQLGKFYRLPVIGKKSSNRSASIRLLADGVAYLHNFTTGENKTVFADDLPTDPKAIAERKRIATIAHKQALAEQRRIHNESALKANAVWQMAKAVQSHPYLNRKRLQPLGLRQHGYDLIVPVYSFATGFIMSLQRIKPNGEKRFTLGGKIAGGFFATRNRQGNERIIIAEGWATSQSLAQQWQVQGWHLVCFDAGNMPKLAQLVRLKYPQAQIILAGDNDHTSAVNQASMKGIIYDPNNPDHERFNAGIYHAKEASRLINGVVSIPTFTADELERFPNYSDWHDRFMLDQMQVKGVRYVG